MFRKVWAILVFSTYTSAIAWIVISNIAVKIRKREHSFNTDVVLFALLFIVSAVFFSFVL